MPSAQPIIALLSDDAGLASELRTQLEADGRHSVAILTRLELLLTFLRISPVDALIIDDQRAGTPALDIARHLRRHPRLASPLFRLVVLSRAEGAFRVARPGSGIDLMLAREEPVPNLVEAVSEMLTDARAQTAVEDTRPLRPMPPAARPSGSNVIQLFPELPHH